MTAARRMPRLVAELSANSVSPCENGRVRVRSLSAELEQAIELDLRGLGYGGWRVLAAGASDMVVRARPEVSGRLERCIAIGNDRERACRVWPKLLTEWGGPRVNNGCLQRSARLPEFSQADRFHDWLLAQKVALPPRKN